MVLVSVPSLWTGELQPRVHASFSARLLVRKMDIKPGTVCLVIPPGHPQIAVTTRELAYDGYPLRLCKACNRVNRYWRVEENTRHAYCECILLPISGNPDEAHVEQEQEVEA